MILPYIVREKTIDALHGLILDVVLLHVVKDIPDNLLLTFIISYRKRNRYTFSLYNSDFLG